MVTSSQGILQLPCPNPTVLCLLQSLFSWDPLGPYILPAPVSPQGGFASQSLIPVHPKVILGLGFKTKSFHSLVVTPSPSTAVRGAGGEESPVPIGPNCAK